jgi:hypothetical protein
VWIPRFWEQEGAVGYVTGPLDRRGCGLADDEPVTAPFDVLRVGKRADELPLLDVAEGEELAGPRGAVRDELPDVEPCIGDKVCLCDVVGAGGGVDRHGPDATGRSLAASQGHVLRQTVEDEDVATVDLRHVGHLELAEPASRR